MQNESAKAMTISWFRDDGDANGPYPVPPNEYDGNESAGLQMFANAKGDAQIRVDNSTARNPNGKWDMLVLNVETTGLEELDPPGSDDPAKTGLVTENFIENENWDVDISQVDGDKTLDLAANQEGYESPQLEAPTEADIPPVMIFADTEVVMSDYLTDGDPETSLYVWVDPNRATLTENGEEASFEPGETYEAKFKIHGQTQTVTFEMVDGTATTRDDYEPVNSFGEELSVETTLAAGTAVEMVIEPEEGENMSTEVEVEGNRVLADAENPGTVPTGNITGKFDFSGMEGESFNVYLYAEDDRGGDFSVLLGEGSGTVKDYIDPEYTISNATIRDSKTMTIAYTNPDHDTPAGIANQIGDGHASGDSTIAKNADVDPTYFDEMWLHYETSDEIFEAIRRSPGRDTVEKFQSSPASLDVTQVNAEGEPKTLNLSQNSSGVYVVPDDGDSDPRIYNSSEETGLFFSFKLNEMVFYQDGEPVKPEVGDEFEATLTIETDEGTREETTSFEIVEGKTEVQYPGDQLELTQSEEQEITINSTQARGTAMGIRLVADAEGYDEQSGELGLDGMGQTICCDGPATEPWGTTSATFNTSGLPVGTEVTVQALIVADLPGEYNDTVVVDEVTGVIAEPPSGSVSLSDQSGDGQSVVVEEIELSDGGFVSVHTGSPNGPTIGASSYLESGTHSNVEVALDESVTGDTSLYVMVHQDTNGNEQFDFPAEDGAYADEGGSSLSANAEYTVESSTETTSSSETSGSSDDDTSETTTPGFGVLVAILALLAAALVFVRYD
nr:PGF-CTERM sorting domain-containing protein [Haloprofundus salilacus]